MNIPNKGFKEKTQQKNPDLRGDEFTERVKGEFKDFGEWLDHIADNEGIGTYTLILYRDQYDPNNRGVQINVRNCVPEDIIDAVIQAVSHLALEVAQTDDQRVFVLQKFKQAAAIIEKRILKKVGTEDFFKE